jgi:hypothetical protein
MIEILAANAFTTIGANIISGIGVGIGGFIGNMILNKGNTSGGFDFTVSNINTNIKYKTELDTTERHFHMAIDVDIYY